MNNWDPGVSEPDRHARAFVIDPTDTSAKVYLEILADPSWRVRKAALARVTEFIRTDGLIEGLVQSLASEDNAGLRNAASDALVRIGEASMDDLRRGLASEDVDQRKLVVEAVGLIGGAEAESALLQAMDDADVNVRASAAEALGRTGGSRAAQHVLAALGRYGSDLQSAAYLLDALAMTHASVPLGQIRGFWNTPALRRSLYPVLGNSRDRDALPLLLEGIVSGSRGNRAAAVLALDVLMDATETSEQVGEALRVSQRSKESVLGLLDYDDDEVVSAAVRILVALELPELAPRILEACACRTNIQVAMDALRSLGSEVVRPLLSDIYRVGIEARVSFLEAVELLGRSSDVAELLEIAEFTELRTAEAAVRAVGRIGDDHAVDGLAELLRRAKSEELEELVAHAIAEVGRRHPEPVAAKVRGFVREGDLRVAWLIALGALGDEQDIVLLRRAITDSRCRVRKAAFDAAIIFGDRFPPEAFILGLADESPWVRISAARGLGSYKSQDAVDALLAVVKDRDPWVCAEALKSLGSVGGPRVHATLRSAVASNQSVIALAALNALFKLNPPDLSEVVAPAFRHVDPEVVHEAVSVSVRLSAPAATNLLVSCLGHRSWPVRRASADAMASRRLPVSEEILSERLSTESEPLVLASLRRLASESAR